MVMMVGRNKYNLTDGDRIIGEKTTFSYDGNEKLPSSEAYAKS